LADQALAAAKLSFDYYERVDLASEVAHALARTKWLGKAENILGSVRGYECLYVDKKTKKASVDFCYYKSNDYSLAAYAIIDEETLTGNYTKAMGLVEKLKLAPINRIFAYASIEEGIKSLNDSQQHRRWLVRALKGHAKAIKMLKDDLPVIEAYFHGLERIVSQASNLLTKQEAKDILGLAKR